MKLQKLCTNTNLKPEAHIALHLWKYILLHTSISKLVATNQTPDFTHLQSSIKK